jgi:MFS family permease
MCFSAFVLGLPSIAPAFRDEYDASLAATGAFLASVTLGLVATLFPWGLATDRFGERAVMTVGLGGAAAVLALAAAADSFVAVSALLTLAGASGAAVNSSAGKAIATWFAPDQRGLAFAVRQAAMMVAAALAALTLPRLAEAEGLHVSLLALAGLCLLGATLGAVFIREGAPPAEAEAGAEPPDTLRDGRLWRLSGGSSLVCVAQAATGGFVVLFLHDARGLDAATAAVALAASQFLGGAIRVWSGIWSDRVRSRVVPLRRIAVASTVTLAAAALLVDAPIGLVFAAFVVAAGVSMGWNTVSFAAAAELGGPRSGAALGLQQAVVGLTAALTPIPFALLVDATSWQVAWAVAALFPLLGWLVLRGLPLSEAYLVRQRDRRAATAEAD